VRCVDLEVRSNAQGVNADALLGPLPIWSGLRTCSWRHARSEHVLPFEVVLDLLGVGGFPPISEMCSRDKVSESMPRSPESPVIPVQRAAMRM